VAFGYHGIVPPRDIQYDAELGWTLAPNTREWQSAIDYGVWATIDADGLRIDDERDERASINQSAPTLLVLGDSYAFGYGVPAHAMIASALERELARAPAPYRVRTAGVPGYSTDQELLRWRRLAATIRPARVLLLFHQSDLVDNTRSSVVMGPERYFKPRFEVRDGRVSLTGVPVPDKERLAPAGVMESAKAWFRPLATYALVQSNLLRFNAPAADAGVQAAAPPQTDEVTSALLAELAREVRAAGADLTVALVPASPAVTGRIAAICNAHGLPLIDLAPALAGMPDTILPFDHHWNAQGHAVAAREIAARLSARSGTEPARDP